MIRWFFLIVFIILFSKGNSQNLVPNPGFEGGCPGWTKDDNLGHISPWYSPTTGTPDYFNKCGAYNESATPQNFFGFQYPKEGNGYVGFHCYYNDAYSSREYLQSPLVQPMVVGQMYCVSMYVARGERTGHAIDDLGFFFSLGSYTNYGTSLSLNVIPQINNPSGIILSDTLNWMKVAGTFTADQPYDHITIGNFYENAHANFIYYPNTFMPQTGYYFADEIKIIPYIPANPEIDTSFLFCKNDYLNFEVKNPEKFDQIVWYKMPEYQKIGDGATLSIEVNEEHEIKVEGWLGECMIGETSIRLKENTSYPGVDLGSDLLLCEGDFVVLDAENPGASYDWSTGDTVRQITVDNPGIYWVHVQNDTSCIGMDTIRFSYCDPQIGVIPNLITINNDNINEEFFPIIKNVKDCKIEIYNRWGDLVYHSTEYVSWNDNDTESGLYFWKIEYLGYNDEQWKEIMGWLHVVE